jgi:hypothetical protein
MTPHVPISWGELFDKISILSIKAERLADASAANNVERELHALIQISQSIPQSDLLARLNEALSAVNRRLWDIEDDIRQKEAEKAFDADFIALARSVYKNNDLRAKIKRDINEALGSEIVEEKQYKSYE